MRPGRRVLFEMDLDRGRRARPCQRSRRATATVAVLAVAFSACSGSDDSITTNTDPSNPTIASVPDDVGSGGSLEQVSLDPALAAPLDRVDLTGVPDGFDPSVLDLRLEPDGIDAVVAVLMDDAGPYFLAPMHPDTPFDGGELSFSLSVNGERSPTLDLTVPGLPKSPGAWNEFLDRFQGAIAASAEDVGTTYDELAATAATEVSADLFALKLAQLFLDDGTENDLESLLNSDRFSERDRDLIDALTGAIGLSSLLPTASAISGFMSPAATNPIGVIPAPRTAGRTLRQSGECFDADIQIVGKADLAQKMTTARDNAITEGGAEQSVLDGIGSVTTVGGFVPGIGAGVGAIGTGFAALQLYLNGTAALFPNRLQRIEAKVPTEPFPEDTDAADQWTEVKVLAASSRWSADADIFGTALSAFSTAGSVFAGTRAADLGDLEGFALDSWQTARDNAALEMIEDQGGIIEFCPDSWEIDITGMPYSEGRALIGRFDVDSGAQLFKPKEAGVDATFDDTLRIEAVADTFGGSTVFADYDISVAAINLDAPGEVTVNQAGAEVDITVTINNAVNPELEWLATKGSWVGPATVTNVVEGRLPSVTWSRTHKTSSAPGDFTYSITVNALTSSGLQADGSPQRIKQLDVRLADIIIDPANGVVEKGGALGYTARNTRGDEIAVRWQATGGSIESNTPSTGTYTAGQTPGTYTVTAIAESDSRIRATVPVEIVEVECPSGTWVLRSQTFLDQIAAASNSPAPLVHLDGTFTIEFSAGRTFTATRSDWRFSISTPDGDVFVKINGTDTGRWSVDDGRTTLTIEDVSTHNEVSASVSAGGQVINLGSSVPVDTSSVGGTGSYECNGNVLTVNHEITMIADKSG